MVTGVTSVTDIQISVTDRTHCIQYNNLECNSRRTIYRKHVPVTARYKA
jgi:hypothetical protein